RVLRGRRIGPPHTASRSITRRGRASARRRWPACGHGWTRLRRLSMPDDAVTLTPWETSALVAHMFAVWLREHDLPWVAWEVVPELSEAAFEAFVTQLGRAACRERGCVAE